jgi:hypothetical protein
MDWKYDYIVFGCIFFLPIFLLFFAERALFSLCKSPTKFCEAGPSRYRDIEKWVGNMVILIYGAFFNQFLYFFLLNVLYLAYASHLRNFTRLGQAVIEI